MTEETDTPRYVHNCERCTFLGRFQEFDLYFCSTEVELSLSANPHEWGLTVIARSGNKPDDNFWDLVERARLTEVGDQQGAVLSMARARATERGLLPVPETFYWLSFADPARPEGSQFLGACIVPAWDVISGIRNARLLGCNPGGEVRAVAIPSEMVEKYRPWMVRLLTRVECEEMVRVIELGNN